MDTITPPPLKPGDTIGVMSPSSTVERTDIEAASAILEQRGFQVDIHPQTFAQNHQSAGTTEDKIEAFHTLWARDDISVVWAAGGGNRAMMMLDALDYNLIKAKSKTLIGFSDCTALLNSIYARTGLAGVHGPVLKLLPSQENADDLFDLLAGEDTAIPLNTAKVLNEGSASGPVIGGNLSVFQCLPHTGAKPKPFWEGGILCLEDVGEEPSKIDRMFIHLKRSGVLNEISALLCGQFTNTKETGRPFGFTLEDIIHSHMRDLNIPVIINAPFGHIPSAHSFWLGKPYKIDTTHKIFTPSKP